MTACAPETRTDLLHLLAERGRWRRLGDDLEEARDALGAVPLTGLGDRVAPVAAIVLGRWAVRARVLGVAADEHADAVRRTGLELEGADAAVAGLLRGSWS